ncbi:hypothetical protein ACFY9F_05770 [Streptomyces sp. NPDC012421]|uniref:hypothetical protein n=1 Tax=Streptomyces sp. NPDC012421 TaxID=3364832 RepID=UPI0036E4F35B
MEEGTVPDFGAVLGGIGRGVAAVGRLVWAVATSPTIASEYDAEMQICRLSQFIQDEVPEELHGRAWGLVVDELRRVETEIERMVEDAKVEEQAATDED